MAKLRSDDESGPLSPLAPRRRNLRPGPHGRDRRFAVVWHLAWAGTVAIAAGLLVGVGGLASGVELDALVIAGAAALVGAVLSRDGGDSARGAAVLFWTLAATATCLMTGGIAGPLAVWCLAPLAVATAFRRADGLALGAAASVAAAAIATLGGLLLAPPEPVAWARPWLGLLGLTTVGLGLAAGLVSVQGVTRRQLGAGEAALGRLRNLVDSQPELLLSLDLEGSVLEAFGVAPAGLDLAAIGDGAIGRLAAPQDQAAVGAAVQAAAVTGAAAVPFRPAHDPDGGLVLTLRRTADARLIATLRDDRPQRDREAELERARASAEAQNAGKSRFLANMSHELRTPLNAIMGFSDIMRQRLFGPVSDRYAEYAELIHESGSHLLELINDVLDMSKIEAERFELAKESFDAREAVSAVLRLMRGQADRAQVNLRAALPREPLEAEADRRAIKQIALNLISNALKFTPKGGSVTVTLQGEGDILELVVADTGVGIAADDLERLGRPFEQAGDPTQRAGGAGLGLSLVRAFARLHGGDMILESAPGEGTTVTVRMPVLLPPSAVTIPTANVANEG
jgi:cell cycle sensor histidine kinase DivJ